MVGDGYSPAGKPAKLFFSSRQYAGILMHELKRRAYLDAMGIPTYVSRGAQPGAAPTTRLKVVKATAKAVPAKAPGKVADSTVDSPAVVPVVAKSDQSTAAVPAARKAPRIELTASPRGQRPAPEAGPGPAAEIKAAPELVFSITAFTTGNWLWLEELPQQQALLRDQVQLVQGMARALGWGNHKANISQFKWPIHNNSQLDLGEDAARASLGGFVRRKLEQSESHGIVLLGASCQRWLPVDDIAAKKLVATVSTVEMLRDPLLKKRAWQDLLVLAS
jgi:hypothetical protein